MWKKGEIDCARTGWKRMHNWEEIPYITRMQWPLDISQTRTVLSIEDEAMY